VLAVGVFVVLAVGIAAVVIRC